MVFLIMNFDILSQVGTYLKPSYFNGTLILAIICMQGFSNLHFSDFTEIYW